MVWVGWGSGCMGSVGLTWGFLRVGSVFGGRDSWSCGWESPSTWASGLAPRAPGRVGEGDVWGRLVHRVTFCVEGDESRSLCVQSVTFCAKCSAVCRAVRAGPGRGGRGGCWWCGGGVLPGATVVGRSGVCWWCGLSGPGWCCTFFLGCWQGWWRGSNGFPARGTS